MFMEKKQRKAIYKALFEDGVMVAKNDRHPKTMHCELKLIPNLHIIKTMQSLVSKNFVKESYSWNWYSWALTNDGIIYLRGYLHLAADEVPSTLIDRVRNVPKAVSRPATDRSFSNPRSGAEGRGIYRRLERQEVSAYKQDGAGAGTADMVFRGGFGRGRQKDGN